MAEEKELTKKATVNPAEARRIQELNQLVVNAQDKLNTYLQGICEARNMNPDLCRYVASSQQLVQEPSE